MVAGLLTAVLLLVLVPFGLTVVLIAWGINNTYYNHMHSKDYIVLYSCKLWKTGWE